MKIINGIKKLKKGKTAIVILPAEEYSKYPIATKHIGINRFGEFFERYRFSGYNTIEEAVFKIVKWNKYPPDYIFIEKQIQIEF